MTTLNHTPLSPEEQINRLIETLKNSTIFEFEIIDALINLLESWWHRWVDWSGKLDPPYWCCLEGENISMDKFTVVDGIWALLEKSEFDITELEEIRTTVVKIRNRESRQKWIATQVQKILQKSNMVSGLTTHKLVDSINSDNVIYWIFGTDGKGQGHHIQAINFSIPEFEKWEYVRFLDERSWLDNSVMIVRYIEHSSMYFNILLISISDNRVDNRTQSHTSVFILMPKEVKKSELKTLTIDVTWLKAVVTTILEREKSSLQWVENSVTKSLLV